MAYPSYQVPVSIKGIVFENDKVWLRLNQRKEWELPGGKMDKGEQPEETCAREMEEELGFLVKVRRIVQAFLYVIESSEDENNGVLVVSYSCDLVDKKGDFELESEGGKASFRAFAVSEIVALNMPQFYKDAINEAWALK